MKAYIVHNSPLGTDYWNEGKYSLITEKEVIVAEKCVPDCLYRGFCAETKRSCGFVDTPAYQNALKEYRRTDND